MTASGTHSGANTTYVAAANLSIDIGGTALAYRDLGPRNGVPVVLLNHWGAALDNFDPRIVDGLASRHRVIATDYRGIGASGGTTPLTVDEMARDAIALIRALGFEKVDLFGFSLGGFIAQDITLKVPDLVRKLILAGTGPAGGKDIDKVGLSPSPSSRRAFAQGRIQSSSCSSPPAIPAPGRRGFSEAVAGAQAGPGQGPYARGVRAAVASNRGGRRRRISAVLMSRS